MLRGSYNETAGKVHVKTVKVTASVQRVDSNPNVEDDERSELGDPYVTKTVGGAMMNSYIDESIERETDRHRTVTEQQPILSRRSRPSSIA